MSNSESVMRAQRRKKIDAVERFGGKCCLCGYNKCINALEFHHLENKEESPAYVIMRWSWERAKKELEKCILMCANCHREVHYNDREIDLQNLVKPWIECECEGCKLPFETKEVDQKFCSRKCVQLSQRKTERPTKEILIDLLNNDSFVSVGKMYGVSDNSIRKWCKNFGIDPKNINGVSLSGR